MAYEKVNWTSTKPVNVTNLKKMDDAIEQHFNDVDTNIGDLENLNTTEKSNLVGAINEVNNKHNYSTEEQVIGTNIDGKPLYRKTIEWNNYWIGCDSKYPHGIQNVDKIITYKGYFDAEGLVYEYPLVSRAGAVLGANVSPTEITWAGNDSWGEKTNRTHRFIIDYTKTTD